MSGIKAYTIGYAAHTARHEDLLRRAAEQRRIARSRASRPRRGLRLGLRSRRIRTTGRSATTAA